MSSQSDDVYTPGGRRLAKHAQESLPRHGFHELSEVDDVIENPTRTTTQTDGGTVYIKRVGSGRQRKYDVVIESDRGIVTGVRNLRPQELKNMGRRNGFNPNPLKLHGG
jgi:hypothetical protein